MQPNGAGPEEGVRMENRTVSTELCYDVPPIKQTRDHDSAPVSMSARRDSRDLGFDDHEDNENDNDGDTENEQEQDQGQISEPHAHDEQLRQRTTTTTTESKRDGQMAVAMVHTHALTHAHAHDQKTHTGAQTHTRMVNAHLLEAATPDLSRKMNLKSGRKNSSNANENGYTITDAMPLIKGRVLHLAYLGNKATYASVRSVNDGARAFPSRLTWEGPVEFQVTVLLVHVLLLDRQIVGVVYFVVSCFRSCISQHACSRFWFVHVQVSTCALLSRPRNWPLMVKAAYYRHHSLICSRIGAALLIVFALLIMVLSIVFPRPH